MNSANCITFGPVSLFCYKMFMHCSSGDLNLESCGLTLTSGSGSVGRSIREDREDDNSFGWVMYSSSIVMDKNDTKLSELLREYQLIMLERAEPVFLNVYGARESIPRNEFRQSTWRAGTITLFLLGSYSPHRLFKKFQLFTKNRLLVPL
jgi:hypothetical protein